MKFKFFYLLIVVALASFVFADFVFGVEEGGDGSGALDAAYSAVANTETTTAPSLDGLSDKSIANLLENKQNDDRYKDFINRLSHNDFVRGLRANPSLISRDGNQQILNRLDKEIEKDTTWINRGFWRDNSEIKKSWLRTKGFNDGSGRWSWDGVEIKSFNSGTGMLELKGGDKRTTKVNTLSVAIACTEHIPCLTLSDKGEIITRDRLTISGGTLSGVSPNTYKLEENGNSVPIVDIGDATIDDATTVTHLQIDAKGTQIVDNRGVLGRERLIARDTQFEVSGLRSGGVTIKKTDKTIDVVEVFQNSPGLREDYKAIDLVKGMISVDCDNSIIKFGEGTSNAKVFDRDGNRLFSADFNNGDVISPRTYEEIKKLVDSSRTSVVIDHLSESDVVSVRDGLLTGPMVYINPASNGDFSLTEFQNGVYLKTDFSEEETGSVKASYGTGENTFLINCNSQGASFSQGEAGLFRGVSECVRPNNKMTRIVFDNGHIFGIGKDKVRVIPLSGDSWSGGFHWKVEDEGEYSYDAVESSSASTAPPARPTTYYTATNAATKSQIKAFFSRQKLVYPTDIQNRAQNSNNWEEFLSIIQTISQLYGQKTCEEVCGKILDSESKEKCKEKCSAQAPQQS